MAELVLVGVKLRWEMGTSFTVSLQQSVFWHRLQVPELSFLGILPLVRESHMEKHSHKVTGSFVSALG